MTVLIRITDQQKRDRIWKILRVLRKFTIDEVVTLSEVKGEYVVKYIKTLFYAGYVRQAGLTDNPQGRKVRLYHIAKDTGPKAPIPCRCLYDPNIDDVRMTEKPEEVPNVAQNS